MKALVTGGAGFIGSHIVERLLVEGHNVIVLDDLSTGRRENLPHGVELTVGSVSDAAAVEQATQGADVIFHLAAVSSVQDSLARPLEVHRCNLSSTLLLLEAARKNGVKRFVFSSSAAVYGDTGGLPAREDMIPKPLSHYAVQKLACEHYCAAYHRLYGLETVSLRYFNIFGPRQRDDSPYSGVIAKFIACASSGRPLTIYGDGTQSRDFCPVANVVEANFSAASMPAEKVAGNIFNVGTGEMVSINELAEMIKANINCSTGVQHVEAKSGEILFSKADICRAQQMLNFRGTQQFGEALSQLCESRQRIDSSAGFALAKTLKPISSEN
jgi:nucleoside-diphosphate-sugar epimerase